LKGKQIERLVDVELDVEYFERKYFNCAASELTLAEESSSALKLQPFKSLE